MGTPKKETEVRAIEVRTFAPRRFRFTIREVSPLLMHRDARIDEVSEMGGQKSRTRKKNIPTREEECARSLYRAPDGKIGMPSFAVWRSLVNAGKQFPGRFTKRGNASREIASGLVVLPGPDAILPLLINGKQATEKDFIPDTRAARNSDGTSVMRSRPRFHNWSIAVEAEIDPEMVNPDMLPELLYIAGRREGIGDFRPSAPKSPGPFGRYKLEGKIEEIR